MSARQDDRSVLDKVQRVAPKATMEHARTLRRAALVLHRWDELECGDSNNYRSWCISRDEETGKPYMEVSPHQGKSYRDPIADREAGAIRRVEAVCKELKLHFYHQGDCRGCPLYVAKQPINGSNYTNGVAIYVD